MIRFVRDLRLIPIALIASVCLLTLKTADLVFDGSNLFKAQRAPVSKMPFVHTFSPASPPSLQNS